MFRVLAILHFEGLQNLSLFSGSSIAAFAGMMPDGREARVVSGH